MEILSIFGKILGLNPSMKKRFDRVALTLADAKARNIQLLEALKEKIKQIEGLILRKKKEYDQARGPSQRIVGREIEQAFRDLDLSENQENIIFGNIDRISIAQRKVEGGLASLEKGVDEDQLTDILLDVQGLIDDLKVADKAARELERESYEPSRIPSANTEARVAEIAGERESSHRFSQEIVERLKRLESE